MKKVWDVAVIIASIGNAVNIVSLWHGGEPPDWFVWLFAIFFCVSTALDAIGELAGFKS